VASRESTLGGRGNRKRAARAQGIELWRRIESTIETGRVGRLHLPHRNRLVINETSYRCFLIDRERCCPIRLHDPEPQMHGSEIAIGLGKVLQRWRYSSGKSAAGRGGAVEVKERNISHTGSEPGAGAPDRQGTATTRNYHSQRRLGDDPRGHFTQSNCGLNSVGIRSRAIVTGWSSLAQPGRVCRCTAAISRADRGLPGVNLNLGAALA